MSKIFSGTVTINEVPRQVRGPLSLSGSRLTGTLSFVEDDTFVIPITAKAINGQLFTSQNTFFLDPDSVVVKILPIEGTDTSIDSDFTEIFIEAPILVDEDNGTIVITLASAESRISADSFSEDNLEEVNTRTKKTLTRVRINEVGNLFDHFGNMLSLPRIEGETNQSYGQRIRSVPSKRRGSSYRGLLNAIALELNLNEPAAIQVLIRDDATSSANKLRALVEEGSIKLYSEWVSEEDQREGLRPVIEQEALLGQEPIKTVGKLVDWINQSTNFKAVLIKDSELSTKFITQFDSRIAVKEELVGQEIVSFGYKNIIPGSILFTKLTELRQEKPLDSDLNSAGEYKIDYTEGLLYCFSAPERIKVTYLVSLNDFKLTISDVKIVDLATKGAQQLHFVQTNKTFYQTMKESTTNGLPKEEMYRIIREILTAGDFDQYWGE